jgi:hypothetical protein
LWGLERLFFPTSNPLCRSLGAKTFSPFSPAPLQDRLSALAFHSGTEPVVALSPEIARLISALHDSSSSFHLRHTDSNKIEFNSLFSLTSPVLSRSQRRSRSLWCPRSWCKVAKIYS